MKNIRPLSTLLCVLLVSVLILFQGCRKKAGPDWDTDILFPLAKTTLTIDDIFADSLIREESDQSLTLVYERDFLNLNMDSVFTIPDTTIKETFNTNFTINAAPGQQFYGNSKETTYNFGKAQIHEVDIRSGKLQLILSSTIKERTVVNLQMPSAEKNGNPLNISATIPAATASQNGSVTKSFDLSNYHIDMTGLNNDNYNTVFTNINAHIHPDGDTTLIQLSDKLNISYQFNAITPDYARGYFGRQQYTTGKEEVDFLSSGLIRSGAIDLKEVNIKLRFENYVGADAEVTLNKLEAVNTHNNQSIPLNHSLISDNIHLNRAVETGSIPPVSEKVFEEELTTSNSNIDKMIELFPDKLQYSIDAEINPLGNVSNNNDFIYYDYPLNTRINMEIPLELNADGLTLTDTAEISLPSEEEGGVNKGLLTLHAHNSFPLESEIRIFLLDQDKIQVHELSAEGVIEAGIPDNTGIVNEATDSRIPVPLSENDIIKLEQASYMVFVVSFTSHNLPDYVKLYEGYEMNLQLTGDFNYHVHTE